MKPLNLFDDYSNEYKQYFLNEYQQDFENCFYTDFYIHQKPNLLSNAYFSNTNSINELNTYLTTSGIRDKKRKFNFIITNVFNGFISQAISLLGIIKLENYINALPLAQCIQWQQENNLRLESPFVLLTLYDKWPSEKIEFLKIACKLYLINWIQLLIDNKIQIDPIQILESIINNDFIKQREFISSQNLLPIEISNEITITISGLIRELKFEQPITQNLIQNKLEMIKKLITTNEKLIVAIGDIHGCYESLTGAIKVLNKLNLPTYFLGDYIDRGPSSIKTIDLLIESSKMNKNWHYIIGNHEQSLIQIIEEKQIEAMASILGKRHSISEYLQHPDKLKSHYVFLKSLPNFIELSHIILLHGGIHDPSIRSMDQHPIKDLLWNYGVHKYWNGKKIIRGHEVHTEPKEYHNNIVLDTGLVFGGYLSIAVIENSDANHILKAVIKMNQKGLILDIQFY